MKLVRNLAAALVLACVLTVNGFAGDQQTPAIVTPPPPPPASNPMTTDTTGTKVNVLGIEEPADDLLITALLALLSVF